MREGGPLGLLPFPRRIVGMEQVRTELPVRHSGEVAAAAGIANGELNHLARKGTCGHLIVAAARAAQDHQAFPRANQQLGHAYPPEIAPMICSSSSGPTAASRATGAPRRNTFTWRRSAPCSSTTQ